MYIFKEKFKSLKVELMTKFGNNRTEEMVQREDKNKRAQGDVP